MTATGVILIMLFAALVGGVVGYNAARNKYYKPINRAGGSGSGSPAGEDVERRD